MNRSVASLDLAERLEMRTACRVLTTASIGELLGLDCVSAESGACHEGFTGFARKARLWGCGDVGMLLGQCHAVLDWRNATGS